MTSLAVFQVLTEASQQDRIYPDSYLTRERILRGGQMKRSSLLIPVFAIAFALFFITPPLTKQQFALYPLVRIGDVIDLFTPLVLLPLYWLLYRTDNGKPPGTTGTVLFMVLAALWVGGQGMHLAANSIGHLLEEMEISDAYNLTKFYDEILSHYLWHVGIVGLAALIMLRQWRNPPTKDRTALWPVLLAGGIHGFTFFLIIIEGGTAPLGVTFALLAVLFGLVWGRKVIRQRPLLIFFFTSFLVATAFFIGWAIYWGGLPEFSQVGIID